MPGGYFHQCCAERACAVSGITPVEMAAMRLGAQGPDPLFLMGMFPLSLKSRPSKLAKSMHSRRTGRFLCALLRQAKQAGSVERAYAMGFLTHYAVDSALHPYVYSKSYDKKGRYSSPIHMKLERGWDTELWKKAGNRGTPFSMPCVQEAEKDWPQVSRLLSAVCAEVFPEMPEKPEAFARAFSDTCLANRLTHTPLGIKFALYWALERLIIKPGLLTAQCCPPRASAKDTFNRDGKPWHSVSEPERERTETVEELMAQGVSRAAHLMSAAQRYFSSEMTEDEIAAIVGDVGMDTGIKSRD